MHRGVDACKELTGVFSIGGKIFVDNRLAAFRHCKTSFLHTLEALVAGFHVDPLVTKLVAVFDLDVVAGDLVDPFAGEFGFEGATFPTDSTSGHKSTLAVV